MSGRELCQTVNVLHSSLLHAAVCSCLPEECLIEFSLRESFKTRICYSLLLLCSSWDQVSSPPPALENPHPIHFT
jgi:hypothetical protein